MFGAGTKALLAKYCLDIWLHLLKQIIPQGQRSTFSVHSPAHLRHLWQIIFILVFVTNYPISRPSLTDTTFGYPLTGQSDTIWQA